MQDYSDGLGIPEKALYVSSVSDFFSLFSIFLSNSTLKNFQSFAVLFNMIANNRSVTICARRVITLCRVVFLQFLSDSLVIF